MNDIIRAMEERRSIRSFKPEMPPKEDIEQIIKAGLYAPSGRGEQATIILAVTNKKIIKPSDRGHEKGNRSFSRCAGDPDRSRRQRPSDVSL